MSEPIIKFQNVYKKFSYVPDRPQSVKSLLVSLTTGAYFRLKRDEKVVLDDVSFSIGRSEIVGIMGRNGTGKSTLLRILCGIYRADSGEVIVRERVAPLVALGAGFHNDLSGYENIFLNGSILGIERKELQRLAPAIIEFSELGEQIHHPLKNYSSGMILRLGFSVAVHVDAPILILDEVLGVGDAGFQKKCHDKILELFGRGRTVLLVTHNPAQVAEFCNRCIVLDRGKVVHDGAIAAGVALYEKLF